MNDIIRATVDFIDEGSLLGVIDLTIFKGNYVFKKEYKIDQNINKELDGDIEIMMEALNATRQEVDDTIDMVDHVLVEELEKFEEELEDYYYE